MNPNTPPRTIEAHQQLIGTLYLLLAAIRTKGLLDIEEDIEAPRESARFNRLAPYDTANEVVYTFVCDVMRLMVYGCLDAQEMTRYMESYRRTSDLTPEQTSLFETTILTLQAALAGSAPQIAVEFGRQGIPAALKPSSQELYDFTRSLHQKPEPSPEQVATMLDAFFDSIDAPPESSPA